MLSSRKSEILKAVILEYVKTVKPVSSEVIAQKYRLGVSSATIRNEFADLTKEGYLYQPHTSAGRIPTNLGYRYYLQTTLGNDGIFGPPSEAERIEENSEELAEKLAENSRLLAASWNEADNIAMRGLKYLFSQPEFKEPELALQIAEIIESLPEILLKLFSMEKTGGICIGSEFELWETDIASIIFRKVRFPNLNRGIACIIGPTRMNYIQHWNLLKE